MILAVFEIARPPEALVVDVIIVIGTDAPIARVEIVHVTVPFVLTGGPEQTLAGLTDTKFTPSGSTSVTTTVVAVLGPLFVTCKL